MPAYQLTEKNVGFMFTSNLHTNLQRIELRNTFRVRRFCIEM